MKFSPVTLRSTALTSAAHVRPENRKEDRKDRRLKENQSPNRRVVVAFRQRGGRTLPFVTKAEAEGVALAMENVDRMATLSADEASHWDMLHAGWPVERVNHSLAYSDHGKHTNWVESYFSRLRRMVTGQQHHVSHRYLYQYANHAAWLEDNRRTDNGSLARGLVQTAMGSPVSRTWKGYWQRRKNRVVPPSGTTRPKPRDAGQDQAEPAGVFDGKAARQPVGAGVVVVKHALQAGDLGAAAPETRHDLADLVGFGGILGIIDPDDRAPAWSAHGSARGAWSSPPPRGP